MPVFQSVSEIKSFIKNQNINTLRVYLSDDICEDPIYLGSYLANFPENTLYLEEYDTLKMTLYKSTFQGKTLDPSPFTITNSSLKQYIFTTS